MHILYHKEPALIFEWNVYVPHGYDKHSFEHYKFITDVKLFSIKEINNIFEKWLYMKSIALTQDYQQFQKIVSDKKNLLPLYRKAIVDDLLSDRSHLQIWFNLGLYNNWSTYLPWKLDVIRRLRILKDQVIIPQLISILWWQDENYMSDDLFYILDSTSRKTEVIKTLIHFWRKDIILDAIKKDKFDTHLLKNSLEFILCSWLNETDLPLLLSVAEHIESRDSIEPDIDYLFLHSISNSKLGIIGYDTEKETGRIRNRHNDSNSPTQRLVLKSIAKVWTKKAFDILEYFLFHSVYYEFQRLSLAAIRYLLEYNRQQLLSWKKLLLNDRDFFTIQYKYYYPSTDDIISSIWKAMKYARNGELKDIEHEKYKESRKKQNLESLIISKLKKLEYLDYIKWLQLWNKVSINTDCYMGDYFEWEVVTITAQQISIKSTFLNKSGKQSIRRFTMKWFSITPRDHYINDRGEKDLLYYYIVKTNENASSPINYETSVPLVGELPRDSNDLPF